METRRSFSTMNLGRLWKGSSWRLVLTCTRKKLTKFDNSRISMVVVAVMRQKRTRMTRTMRTRPEMRRKRMTWWIMMTRTTWTRTSTTSTMLLICHAYWIIVMKLTSLRLPRISMICGTQTKQFQLCCQNLVLLYPMIRAKYENMSSIKKTVAVAESAPPVVSG
jgi:hypothetical protein